MSIMNIFVAGAGALVTLISTAGNAAAQSSAAATCQKKLVGLATSHERTTISRLHDCADRVQRRVDAGKALRQVDVKYCNRAASRILSKRSDLVGECLSNASVKKNCTAAVLHRLGHLVSGVNAPGPVGETLMWVCNHVIERAEHRAIGAALAANPRMDHLWAAAAAAATPGDAIADYFAAKPNCATHACQLAAFPASEASLKTAFAPGGVPMSPAGHLAMDLCKIDTSGPLGDRLTVGGTQVKMTPPQVVLGHVICLSSLNAEGYCHCGGTAPNAHDVSLCRDSSSGDRMNPGACGSGIIDEIDTDPSSNNGPSIASYGGAVPPGGCVVRLAVRLVIFPFVGTLDCSASPLPPLPTSHFVLTTGTATATIHNSNDGGPTLMGTQIGAPAISCDSLRTSLSGLALAGAVPIMDSPFGDTVIDLRLACQ